MWCQQDLHSTDISEVAMEPDVQVICLLVDFHVRRCRGSRWCYNKLQSCQIGNRSWSLRRHFGPSPGPSTRGLRWWAGPSPAVLFMNKPGVFTGRQIISSCFNAIKINGYFRWTVGPDPAFVLTKPVSHRKVDHLQPCCWWPKPDILGEKLDHL